MTRYAARHGSVVRVTVRRIPLQAADLLAYELFDPTRKIAQDGYIKRIKKTFDALDDGTPGDLGLTKPEHLKVMRVSLERDEPLP